MNLLMLGGTAEAREIAETLKDWPGVELTVSLAGATRAPQTGAARTRIGGFGGDAGFEAYLDQQTPDAILDATHPFAAAITRRSARIANARRIPYRLLLRAGWTAQRGDTWIDVADEAEAAARVGPEDRVFLATGRQTLSRFQGMVAAYTWCRQIDPPGGDYPFDRGEFLVGRPPFSLEDEIALFKRLGVTVLIVKHAGGASSRSKLDAARALGIPVIMIRRPDFSGVPQVATVAEALDWVRGLAHAHHSL